MLHEVSSNEDMMNMTEKYPFEKFKDCGKIKFKSHNDLLLFMHEQFFSYY